MSWFVVKVFFILIAKSNKKKRKTKKDHSGSYNFFCFYTTFALSHLVWSNIFKSVLLLSQPPIILEPTSLQARFYVGSIMFLEITFVQCHKQLYLPFIMCILFVCLFDW